jgi:hypothetical protein
VALSAIRVRTVVDLLARASSNLLEINAGYKAVLALAVGLFRGRVFIDALALAALIRVGLAVIIRFTGLTILGRAETRGAFAVIAALSSHGAIGEGFFDRLYAGRIDIRKTIVCLVTAVMITFVDIAAVVALHLRVEKIHVTVVTFTSVAHRGRSVILAVAQAATQGGVVLARVHFLAAQTILLVIDRRPFTALVALRARARVLALADAMTARGFCMEFLSHIGPALAQAIVRGLEALVHIHALLTVHSDFIVSVG